MEETKKTEKKKEAYKVCDVVFEVRPICIQEYISGIFRYHVKDGQLVPPTWTMKCYSIFTSIFYSLCFAIFIDLPNGFNENSSVVDFIDEIPPVVVVLQYIATLLTTTFLMYEQNSNIIMKFAELDKQLLLAGTDYYSKSRSTKIKLLSTLIVTHLITIIIDVTTEPSGITIGRVLAYPLYLIQKVEILMFCITITMLNYRLRLINKYLAKFVQEKNKTNSSVFTVSEVKEVTKDVSNFIGSPSKNNMKIRDLAVTYDLVGVICASINNIFNFQIFMTLVSTFIYIVVTIWTSLFYYKTPEDNSGPLITITIWCLTTILTVSTMCYVCENLKVVRNHTKVLVNQIIMDYDLPKGMRVQAKAFMELIEAWPLRIFIYDMFSVDIALILKFISVSTTYLIVIIQISHFI